MSPGYLPRSFGACPECKGTDVGGVGFIHHAKTCSRNPYCSICGLELLPGERRGPGKVHAHMDCVLDLEAQLDEDHREDVIDR